MRMHRCFGALRSCSQVDTQQIFICSDRWNRSDLGNLGAVRCRGALGAQGKYEDLAGHFRDQRRRDLISYGSRVPTVGANGGLGIPKRGEIFHPPVEWTWRELLDLLLGDRFDGVLRLRRYWLGQQQQHCA
jgi:hypothetical protein